MFHLLCLMLSESDSLPFSQTQPSIRYGLMSYSCRYPTEFEKKITFLLPNNLVIDPLSKATCDWLLRHAALVKTYRRYIKIHIIPALLLF